MHENARRWRYVAIGFAIVEATSLINAMIGSVALHDRTHCPMIVIRVAELVEQIPHK